MFPSVECVPSQPLVCCPISGDNHTQMYNQYKQCIRNHGVFVMTENKSSKSSGEKCHIWGLTVVSGYGGHF